MLNVNGIGNYNSTRNYRPAFKGNPGNRFISKTRIGAEKVIPVTAAGIGLTAAFKEWLSFLIPSTTKVEAETISGEDNKELETGDLIDEDGTILKPEPIAKDGELKLKDVILDKERVREEMKTKLEYPVNFQNEVISALEEIANKIKEHRELNDNDDLYESASSIASDIVKAGAPPKNKYQPIVLEKIKKIMQQIEDQETIEIFEEIIAQMEGEAQSLYENRINYRISETKHSKLQIIDAYLEDKSLQENENVRNNIGKIIDSVRTFAAMDFVLECFNNKDIITNPKAVKLLISIAHDMKHRESEYASGIEASVTAVGKRSTSEEVSKSKMHLEKLDIEIAKTKEKIEILEKTVRKEEAKLTLDYIERPKNIRRSHKQSLLKRHNTMSKDALSAIATRKSIQEHQEEIKELKEKLENLKEEKLKATRRLIKSEICQVTTGKAIFSNISTNKEFDDAVIMIEHHKLFGKPVDIENIKNSQIYQAKNIKALLDDLISKFNEYNSQIKSTIQIVKAKKLSTPIDKFTSIIIKNNLLIESAQQIQKQLDQLVLKIEKYNPIMNSPKDESKENSAKVELTERIQTLLDNMAAEIDKMDTQQIESVNNIIDNIQKRFSTLAAKIKENNTLIELFKRITAHCEELIEKSKEKDPRTKLAKILLSNNELMENEDYCECALKLIEIARDYNVNSAERILTSKYLLENRALRRFAPSIISMITPQNAEIVDKAIEVYLKHPEFCMDQYATKKFPQVLEKLTANPEAHIDKYNIKIALNELSEESKKY